MIQETMLTAQDVAARWGVCVQTVYRLAAKRDGLPAYKVGRCIRFKADGRKGGAPGRGPEQRRESD